MKKLAILTSLFLHTLLYGQQVPPQGINFQAVLFDEFGTPVPSINESATLSNQSAEATFTFYNFSSGVNYYSETHKISTDEYGRFQVVLGRGTPIGSNTFQNIQWSDGNIFLDFEVSLNGQSKRLVSSQELLSVPYALFAGGIQGASDLDDDPSNEIQELAIDADSIYISKGNAVPIPLDGDKSSSNELQSLSVVGNQITISNGNTVSLPVVLDPSPTNELQSLLTQGDSLTISNGNTVITDPSSSNELQNLSIQGNNLTISNGNTVGLPTSLDNDTTNEIQELELSSNGFLRLTRTNDSVYVGNSNVSAGGTRLRDNKSNEFCFQGNPEVIDLSILNNYGLITPIFVFDSIAFFTGRTGTGTTALTYLFKIDLYSNTILSTSQVASSPAINNNTAVQNDTVAYIFGSNVFYKISSKGDYMDTISYSGQSGRPIVFPNGDVTWFNGYSIFTYNRSSQNITSTLTSATIFGGQAIGNDSILVGNKIYNTSTGVVIKTYSITNAIDYSFRYNESSAKLFYKTSTTVPPYATTWYLDWYTSDLNGNNSRHILTEPDNSTLTTGYTTIDGMFIFKSPSQNNVLSYNGYYTIIPSQGSSSYSAELFCMDFNGEIFPVKKPSISNSLVTKGNYTVIVLAGNICRGTSASSLTPNPPYSLLRYLK